MIAKEYTGYVTVGKGLACKEKVIDRVIQYLITPTENHSYTAIEGPERPQAPVRPYAKPPRTSEDAVVSCTN